MTVNLTDQRVIYNDGSTLTDVSLEVNSFREGSFTLSFNNDFIYIGSVLPFNHKYFDMGATVNAVSAVVNVELWSGSGSGWKTAVDIIDETDVSGVSLAQDGNIRFKPDRNDFTWTKEQDSFDVTGLETTNIYDMYWCRFSWDAVLTPSIIINNIGHLFSDDNALFSEYPELQTSALFSQWESGKTSWEEQHFISAESIIRDLVSKHIILKADQMLEPETFQAASIHKCARIIFGGLGPAYEDRQKAAGQAYHQSLNLSRFNVDTNANAINDNVDKLATTGRMSR